MKMALENKIEVIRGVNYKPSIDLRTPSDADSIALLRANNIKNGCIAFNDVQYVSKSKVKIEQLLRKGDILVCASSGSKQLVGKAALITRDIRATFGAFCCVIRPISISPCFLSNYFLSSAYRMAIEEACSGSNINNLKPKNFYDLQIPNYSLDEQAEISEKLSKARSLIERCQSLNIYLDELVKSRFVEMSNSEECSKVLLGSLVRSMHIGPFGSALKNDAFVSRKKASCVVYEQKHAINKRIDFNWRYVDESKRAELKRFEVGPGTILVSCRGTLGKVYQLPDRAPIGIIHPSLMKIEINDSKVDATYFVSLLEELFTEAEARAEGSGVKMAIRAKELGVAEVEIPSLDKQKRFATFVHQVDKLKFDFDFLVSFSIPSICLFCLKLDP